VEDGKRHKRKHKGKAPKGQGAFSLKAGNVRLAAARERELEWPKRQHEQETQSTNGVRLKGFFSLSFFSASVRSPFLRVAGLMTAYTTARVASCYLRLGPGPFPFRTSRSLVLST